MLDSILINGLCILVLAVLVLGSNLQKSKKSKPTMRFELLCFSVISFLFVSILSIIAENVHADIGLIYVVDTMTFLAVDVIVVAFTVYVFALLNLEKCPLNLSLVYFTCALRSVSTIVLTVMGRLFTIENFVYVEQDLVFIPYVFSFVIMLELLVNALYYRKRFTKRQFRVILLYLLLPVPATAIELVWGAYVVTGAAITLSVLLIYVLLQSSTIEQGQMRETLLEEISETDQLTGIGNRRAYYRRIQALVPDESVGVMFCDLNGLKEVNDHYGHTAGDEYIQKFAMLLTTTFPFTDAFRVSGDEFIVVLTKYSEADFRKHAEDFRSVVKDNQSIASLGAAYGAGRCVERLTSEAESLMYEEKRAYWTEKGISDSRFRR